MPLRFVLDEHLRGPLLTAFDRHNAAGEFSVDVVQIGDVADLPLGTRDPELLQWAQVAGRILLTRDYSTIPAHLQEHLAKGLHSPGVMIVLPHASIRDILAFVVFATHASEPHEWQDRIAFIP